MSQVACEYCGVVSSHTYSPSEYEGYFLTDALIDSLGVSGHREFDTVLDFLEFLKTSKCEYVFQCKNCGAIILDRLASLKGKREK